MSMRVPAKFTYYFVKVSGAAKKPILLSILAICLIGGWFFYSKTSNTPAQNLSESSETVKYEGYVAGVPHYGPLIHTQKIEVKYNGDKASGTLEKNSAKEVAIYQKVILYDKENFILPLGGKVTDVKTEENSSDITIELPRDTNSELLSNELEIITLETKASKRLPLSALQRDKNNETYVWVVEKEENKEKQKLRRQYIDVGMKDKNYFEEFGQAIGTFDLVLLNPDKKIKSDKAYKIEEIEFTAPLHNPIKQAWIDFELNHLKEQQEELAQALDECRKRAADKKNGVAPPITGTPETGSSSSSSSCGSPSSFQGTDPFAIFNSLTAREGLDSYPE